jgi:hypothetical protein
MLSVIGCCPSPHNKCQELRSALSCFISEGNMVSTPLGIGIPVEVELIHDCESRVASS